MIAWARGQRLEVRLQRLLLTSISFLSLLHIFVWFIAVLCGSSFSPLNSDLEPLTLFPCSDRFALQTGIGGEPGGFVGCLPGEIGVAAAEVSIRRGLAVNRTPQIKRIDDLARLELEVRPYQTRNQLGVDLLGSESIHQYTNGFSYSDGVGELHFATIGQSGGHDVLRDIARHVGGRTVHLGRILAAERAAAVTSHATVRVHDDLASGETGIAHGAANDEPSGGIDVVLGVLIEQVGRNNGLDDVLQNVGTQFVVANIFGMLGGDDYGIDPLYFTRRVVFDRDL